MYAYKQLGRKRPSFQGNAAFLIENPRGFQTFHELFRRQAAEFQLRYEAALEAGYRLIRNQAIKPSAIAEGLYKVTYQKTQERKLLLAIEDTTTLSYSHEVDALGDTGGPSNAVSRGFHAHSVLLVDAQTEGTIGLISKLVGIDRSKREVNHIIGRNGLMKKKKVINGN